VTRSVALSIADRCLLSYSIIGGGETQSESIDENCDVSYYLYSLGQIECAGEIRNQFGLT